MSKEIREDHIFKLQFELVDGTNLQNHIHNKVTESQENKPKRKAKKPKK
jgi:hypothetical protein